MSTPKQIAAGQIRTLRSMRKKLLDMSVQWDDVDMYFMSLLEKLSDQVENAGLEMVNIDKEIDI